MPDKETKLVISEFKKLFKYKWIVEDIGFFLFLCLLMIVYIANGHKAEKNTRELSRLNRKIVQLEYEYKTLKSELMYKTRESELIRAGEPIGLMLSETPPVHIRTIDRHKPAEE